MKKLLSFLLISGIFTVTAGAQEHKEMKTDHKEWDKKLKTELKLTDDQAMKYDALSKEYGEKIEMIMKDSTLSKDVQKERKMSLKKEKETKLFEFFTPEQQTKYKEMMDRKKAEKPEGK